MEWRAVGSQGEHFRARAETDPGWYWFYRPLNTGPRACDPERGVLLPVLVHADGRLQSPLTDLGGSTAADLVPADEHTGQRYQSWFAGPLPGPGARTHHLRKEPGQAPIGTPPSGDGWWWCRTRGPLHHVDAQGVGPIYIRAGSGGIPWVYPAAFPDGAPADVMELGFAEPLVSEHGLIDQSGEHGRTEAELFGRVAAHPPVPARFLIAGPA
ncbi:hypothetical protein L6R53_14620 [Myxococcota bacterium]|nr:hypothetical protein [Myxococcota bacterium]